jgi:hypothetical protein
MKKIVLAYAFAAQVLGMGVSVTSAWAETVPSPTGSNDAPNSAGLTMPVLAFTPSAEDVLDYDKFFFFHRDQTAFAEAYSDIKECDSLASGFSYYGGNSSAMAGATAQYGLAAGAIGGAIGNLIADAIFGSAERRRLKRISVRNCMNFKGYGRYGLNGDLWKKFNFEEGMGRKREDVREDAMQLQALVAAGPKPSSKDLGL